MRKLVADRRLQAIGSTQLMLQQLISAIIGLSHAPLVQSQLKWARRNCCWMIQ